VDYCNNRFSKSKAKTFLFIGLVLFTLSSCQSYKNIPYFKNIPSDSTYVYKDGIKIPIAEFQEIRIQPNDILSVSIQTIDPELNTVMAGGTNSSAGNTGSASGSLKSGNANDITGFLVDKDGIIELPLAGKIKVAGLTTSEVRDEIRLKAMVYYKTPIVNVRIANFKVTVMGEVERPGSYLINGEKATILDALGEAGDLSIYGLRTNVLLSRNENGKQKMIRFDLTSSDIYDSPYFYLKQGDMIYVQPGKSKAASNDGATVRAYAFITSTLSLLVIVATR
jgi:polysaccharide export outer membrane protein